jgi:hypothetical protein
MITPLFFDVNKSLRENPGILFILLFLLSTFYC